MNFWKKSKKVQKVSMKVGTASFQLTKNHDEAGFTFFILENQSKRQVVVVQKFIFEKFRSFVRDLASDEKKSASTRYLSYKQRQKYSFHPDLSDKELFVINDIEPRTPSTGFLTVSRKSLGKLRDLLYHKDLKEPNDLLNRIIAYHKIFQFTFIDNQESMNSDLALRKEILSHIGSYSPRLAKEGDAPKQKPSASKMGNKPPPLPPGAKGGTKKTGAVKNFETKLGARSGSSPYEVNYDTLLQAQSHTGKSPLKKEEKITANSPVSQYPLTLTTSTVKQYDGNPLECEFNPDEIAKLRKNFLTDSESEFYLGFEMVQAVFKKDKKYKSFTFPLYYMKVNLKQANRILYIELVEDGRFYLNHLALANLVETFNKSASKDNLDQFFSTLIAQNMEVSGKINRIYLSRTLPVAEEYFTRTREILMGDAGADGKRGILADLKVVGIECDIEDVYLYKSKKHLSVLSQALETDLDQILRLAVDEIPRFDASLLGLFVQGQSSSWAKEAPKAESAWMPGALPGSMKKLMDRLALHDLVVLEGPPGTGKTHTIRNLVIDALCSGKRLMVVSDRASAVEALVDKMHEFFLSYAKSESEKEEIKQLWTSCLPCIGELPEDGFNLDALIRRIKGQLVLDSEVTPRPKSGRVKNIQESFDKIIEKWTQLKDELGEILEDHLNPEVTTMIGSATRRGQPSSRKDIDELLEFIEFLESSFRDDYTKKRTTGVEVAERFINLRNWLCTEEGKSFYRYFQFNFDGAEQKHSFEMLQKACMTIETLSPKNCEDLIDALSELGNEYLTKVFADLFNELSPPKQFWFKELSDKFKRKFKHPLYQSLQTLQEKMKEHKFLASALEPLDPSIKKEFKKVHSFLDPNPHTEPFPLVLELCLYKIALKKKLKRQEPKAYRKTPFQILRELSQLQKEKDSLVTEKVFEALNQIGQTLGSTLSGDRTPLKTKISFLCDQVAAAPNLASCQDALTQLQESLWEAYPIWVCRKQVVPLLMPCKEKSVHLIIVDEATQCRVEDTLPLLLRAEKLMVVGDDKQTVLSKESAVDDYLYKEFNLAEHLASAQATSIKGGGSHIFGLLKNIQQASVLLDEHYRCPPDIITYSNRYVYNDQLKIMQWLKKGAYPAVYVDYSEKDADPGKKPSSGPYKGLDVAMIERFLEYITKEIKKIEKQLGRKVNVETDVAICYFLLKNNVYFDDNKSKFLSKLKRGKDILSGAGAALQGKERDFIFYFWDCYKGNFAAFKQGDDENKRKGELNVLMSRPKIRAYHYLHQSFGELVHGKASITDYLWNTFQEDQGEAEQSTMQPRVEEPTEDHPANRGSGQLILSLVKYLWDRDSEHQREDLIKKNFHAQFSETVGNPKYAVDLILSAKKPGSDGKSLCIKDISCFAPGEHAADELIDYYFQLQRAKPSLNPIFCFVHDLIEQEGLVLEEIKKSLIRG
ncbi:MAG: hypothetical protein HRU09_05850 [Oligoflexales bacterium]|nr:hypothetical protein [Oligoflexales bacterium]